MRDVLPDPPDEESLWAWLIGINLAYAAIGYIIEAASAKTYMESIRPVFDGAVCASSVMLLWGVIEPHVLKVIGDTKPYLALAGLAGLFYSIQSLRPRAGTRHE